MSNQYFEKAIVAAGGTGKLARGLGTHATVVSKWRKRGVPAERVLPICRLAGGQVTPYELRCDIYPDPDWLPPLDQPDDQEAA